MQIEKKLEELGLQLPPPPPRGGLYKSCKPFGANLAYVSGCGCVIDAPVEGKLGVDFTLEEGQRYARDAMLNVLSVLKAEIGDLDRVKSCVKILVFVASANDFLQPARRRERRDRAARRAFRRGDRHPLAFGHRRQRAARQSPGGDRGHV